MKMSPLRKRYTPDVMCLNYVLTANNLTVIIHNIFSVGHDKQLHFIDLIFFAAIEDRFEYMHTNMFLKA